MFREWIYIISAIIIMFGFIVGIIQLLLKIKKKNVKIILISTFIMLFLISTSIIYFLEHLAIPLNMLSKRMGKSLLHMWVDLRELMWITMIIKIYL